MRYCKHTQWLTLSIQAHETSLHVTNRIHTLLTDIPNPTTQSPALFVFVGSSTKSKGLKEFVLTKGLKFIKKRAHRDIHLHLDTATAFDSRPILIADGDFPAYQRLTKITPAEKCHKTAVRILPRLRDRLSNVHDLADDIYSKLLSPFADVFCFFCEDVQGLRSIAQRLAS
jgi:hypothetical protein